MSVPGSRPPPGKTGTCMAGQPCVRPVIASTQHNIRSLEQRFDVYPACVIACTRQLVRQGQPALSSFMLPPRLRNTAVVQHLGATSHHFGRRPAPSSNPPSLHGRRLATAPASHCACAPSHGRRIEAAAAACSGHPCRLKCCLFGLTPLHLQLTPALVLPLAPWAPLLEARWL